VWLRDCKCGIVKVRPAKTDQSVPTGSKCARIINEIPPPSFHDDHGLSAHSGFAQAKQPLKASCSAIGKLQACREEYQHVRPIRDLAPPSLVLNAQLRRVPRGKILGLGYVANCLLKLVDSGIDRFYSMDLWRSDDAWRSDVQFRVTAFECMSFSKGCKAVAMVRTICDSITKTMRIRLDER
jgi:hypothetical protein